MKPALCLFALSLTLAGCGAVEQRGGGPASTSQTPDTETSVPFDEAEVTKAPPIMLESEAGRQQAVPGSFCVEYEDEASGQAVGLCGDSGPVSPERLSTVRPGEEIRILLEDADLVRPDGCVSEDEQSCIGTAVVRPLGCERKSVAEIPLALGRVTNWEVELPPGRYELDVFAYFGAGDGRNGDVSGSLGLLVDETAPLEIVVSPASGIGCE